MDNLAIMAAEIVATERRIQHSHGYNSVTDQQYNRGVLAKAAVAAVHEALHGPIPDDVIGQEFGRWPFKAPQGKTPARLLVMAAAFLQAEIVQCLRAGQTEGIERHMKAADNSPKRGSEKLRVPIEPSSFGGVLLHGLSDDLVLIMARGSSGWHAPEGHSHALLSHQVYLDDVRDTYKRGNTEVCVVGLSTGQWRTVWADSDQQVSYPAPAKRLIEGGQLKAMRVQETEAEQEAEDAAHRDIERLANFILEKYDDAIREGESAVDTIIRVADQQSTTIAHQALAIRDQALEIKDKQLAVARMEKEQFESLARIQALEKAGATAEEQLVRIMPVLDPRTLPFAELSPPDFHSHLELIAHLADAKKCAEAGDAVKCKAFLDAATPMVARWHAYNTKVWKSQPETDSATAAPEKPRPLWSDREEADRVAAREAYAQPVPVLETVKRSDYESRGEFWQAVYLTVMRRNNNGKMARESADKALEAFDSRTF